MSPLRQRMLDAMQLRGMAARTCESYLDAVTRLARHYGSSPDTLDAQQVQQYLLHLLRDRNLARSSVNLHGCAYRFLYGSVLGLDGEDFQIPLAPAPQRLPEILAREEIARLFAAACHAKARSLLMLAYGTGLRLSELCALQVAHIDSAADRMCLRVEQGKGAKDRYVPMSSDVLVLLRRWWCIERPARWLFTAAHDASRPLDTKTAAALVSRRRGARRHHQARRHPRPAPRLGHPPARSRRGPVQRSSSGSVTPTSPPPRATCTWRAPAPPTARGASR